MGIPLYANNTNLNKKLKSLGGSGVLWNEMEQKSIQSKWRRICETDKVETTDIGCHMIRWTCICTPL